jgi:hypothetical protein
MRTSVVVKTLRVGNAFLVGYDAALLYRLGDGARKMLISRVVNHPINPN